jgi:hypothetical protein
VFVGNAEIITISKIYEACQYLFSDYHTIQPPAAVVCQVATKKFKHIAI